MRITEHFKLGLTQSGVDFIDVDTNEDTELFLDPELISYTPNAWSERATEVIGGFFARFFELLSDGSFAEARAMFRHLHEPNETCLGYSTGRPRGHGLGDGQRADQLFQSLRASKAATSGVVNDLEDSEMFVPSIGIDTVSDMVTNLIRRLLIEYTQAQCCLHSIPLRPDTPSGYSWNPGTFTWAPGRDKMLVIDNEPRLLVPKWAVSRPWKSPTTTFCREYAVEFERAHQLSIQGPLVQYRKNKERTPYVTSKDIISHGYVSEKKEPLANWAQGHPNVYGDYKGRTERRCTPLSSVEMAGKGIDVAADALALVEKLKTVVPGRDHATIYHKLVAAALELLFYPALVNLKIENKVNAGRKRIDLTFDNRATSGVFQWIHSKLDAKCPLVMVECKNYTDDPANESVDQLAGRLDDHRGRLGILCCRSVKNRERLVDRCRDVRRAGNGICLLVTDAELVTMLEAYAQGVEHAYEATLTELVHEIALS